MSTDAPNLPDDVEQLKAMIASRDAVISQHEEVIASQHAVIEKQLGKLEALQQELARLLRRQYGPRKESIDPNQLTLFSAEELARIANELEAGVVDSVFTDDGSADEDSSAADEPPKQRRKKGHGRRPIPPEIPREVIVHELSDTERMCPCCGKLRTESIARSASSWNTFRHD